MWVTKLGRRLASFSQTTEIRSKGVRRFSSEIFVSRLSYYITDEEFRKLFSRFGEVKEARLIRDGRTQRPKGFGFVNYASEAEAKKAVEAMDGRILGGRLIFVEIARPRGEESVS